MTLKRSPARKARWRNCIETFPTADGQFGWHLKSRNGKIRCQGEGHPTRAGATRAVLGVQLAFSNVPATLPIFHLKAKL